MSRRQQPRSRSSCVRQDSAEASGSRTVSLMRMPALFAAVTRFCVAATEEVTRWTFTSSRWPTMPTASRMPFCASTRNSCGSTCRTSRSSGSVMLRAASTARRTSSRSMSRGRCPSVMPPRLFTPRTWPPATPISASSTGTFATLSASSTARRMELTVESRLTIRPLRRPLDSAAPSARNFTSSPSTSASSTQVFVLPMSSPTRYLSFFAKPPLLGMNLFCSCGGGGRARAGVGIHDHLPRILQIDGLHMAGIRLPLRKIVDQHLEFAGELRRTEVNRYGLRIVGACQPGHHRAQVFRNGEVDLTNAIGRAGAHEINILHEFLVGLHALFALVTRQFFRNAGDNRKMQFFAARTVQDDAMRVNQGQFVAAPSKGDGSALCEFDAEAIRQDALHAGGFDPGNLFQLTTTGFQRDAQNAAVAIMDELLENRFTTDDAIAIHFHLIGLQQQHAERVQAKLNAVEGRS